MICMGTKFRSGVLIMLLRKHVSLLAGMILPATLSIASAQAPDLIFLNRDRRILDAHNCYPYDGRWNDR